MVPVVFGSIAETSYLRDLGFSCITQVYMYIIYIYIYANIYIYNSRFPSTLDPEDPQPLHSAKLESLACLPTLPST